MPNRIKRVVITGPVAVGKTTLIRTITRNQFVDTERLATDITKMLKPKTTVGMDFGRFQIDNNFIFHLYGTPGQSRFDFMWDFLISTADAYVLLVRADRFEQLSNARKIMNFMNQRTRVPMLIGLTNYSAKNSLSKEIITENLGYKNSKDRASFIEVDPQNFTEVKNLLNILYRQIQTNSVTKSRPNFLTKSNRPQNRSELYKKSLQNQKSRRTNRATSRTPKYTPLFGDLNF